MATLNAELVHEMEVTLRVSEPAFEILTLSFFTCPLITLPKLRVLVE
jgi:hypothetical protein